MKRPGISIAGLMGVVLCCGIGVAALRTPSPLWRGAVFTVTLLGLGVSLLGIVYRSGTRRAFWAGFAMFGWGYWVIALGPCIGEQFRQELFVSSLLDDLYMARRDSESKSIDEAVAREFKSRPEVAKMYRELYASREQVEQALARGVSTESDEYADLFIKWANIDREGDELWSAQNLEIRSKVLAGRRDFANDQYRLQIIGHSLCALVSGLFGGVIGAYFYRTRDLSPSGVHEASTNPPQPV